MSTASHELLRRHLEEARGDRVCLHEVHGRWTYRDLDERSRQILRVLAADGLGRGDRVAFVLPDSAALVAGIFAAWRRGAVAVPLGTRLAAIDYATILADCRPKVLVTTRELAAVASPRSFEGRTWIVRADDASELVARARTCPDVGDATDVGDEDPALIQYTSGSTGRPKGVVHLHRGLLGIARGIAAALEIRGDDVCYSPPKLSFGYGFGNSVLMPFSAGASAVLDAEAPDPRRIFLLAEKHRPTVFFGVPSLFAALLRLREATSDTYRLPSVRTYVSAGESLSAVLWERWEAAFGSGIVDALGATETLHAFIAGRPGRSRPGRVGAVVDGYRVELRDDAGRVVRDGETGLLWVQGECVGAEYWERPADTRRTFVGGWVHTGDQMRREPGGDYVFVGRNDDVLKIAGQKVAPMEIEDRLSRHESVRECAVVALTDADGVSAIGAHVTLHPKWAGSVA
ncbi:MAG TPA: AMP-binding protein, partial [Planctomycetota bacterium]|nr:AMP-binding protein [Planctomycetota bacterium]